MIHSDKADQKQSGKKKHWIRRTILIVVAVLVLGLGWFAYTQRNNLKALYLAMTTDAETLQQRQEEQDKKRDEILQQYGLTVPDVSQMDEDDPAAELADPTATPEAEESPSATESAQPTQTPVQTPDSEPEQEQDSEAAMKAQLQIYVNQLYQVEARYRAYIDGIVASAKQEFAALPKEQKNNDNKMKIVRAKVDTLIAQENACDAEVETILSNMQAVLKHYGQSTALVDEIRLYYEDSKATWKAAKMTELYS